MCEELYVSLSEIQKAFKNVDGAQEIIEGLKAKDLDEILQDHDSAETLAKIKEVIEYLNGVLGTHYKPTVAKNKTFIRARLREGFSVDDFKTVIDKKARQWLGDGHMQKFLRPETLFGTKFESYLNEQETYKFTGNKQESTYERIQRLAREGAFSHEQE